MKYVEFIKDHPAGIKVGRVAQVSDNEAERYIKDKFAKPSSEEDRKAYLETFTGEIGAGAKEATDEQKENSKAIRLRINGEPRANAKPKKQIGKKDDGKPLTATEKEFFKTRNEARRKAEEARKGLLAKAEGENEEDARDISTKLNVKDASARIEAMESEEEINEFIDGDTRATVATAVKKRLSSLVGE